MSQSCAVEKCNRASRGLCDCCQKNLCLQHLNEHNVSLVSQLNPLTDDINELGDRLKTLNIQQIIDDCRQKLKQWRDDCHEKIDRFFEQKCHEFDRLVNEKVSKQREELIGIHSKMTELIHAQETTRLDIDLLTSTIYQLRRNMDNIEQTSFTIDTRPLLVDDTVVFIREITEHALDLMNLSPVCKTIDRADGSYVLASNDRFLLIHQQPNLCLIDREMNIVKQTFWPYDAIYDMCWSSALNRFIVIGGRLIFLVDEEAMTINNVEVIAEVNWLSCTCSDTSLFLSTNEYTSSIVEFKLLPWIEFIKEWKYPLTCAREEVISGTAYNNGKLALMIMNKYEKSLRIEQRDAETFDRIWSLRFNTVFNQSVAFRCCVLTYGEYLVSDSDNRRLLHITETGQVKTTISYNTIPYRANLFTNMLVISRKGGINFHKL